MAEEAPRLEKRMAMKNPDYIKNRNANYYRLLRQNRTVCVSSISHYPPSTSILGRLGLASRFGLAPPLGLGLASRLALVNVLFESLSKMIS